MRRSALPTYRLKTLPGRIPRLWRTRRPLSSTDILAAFAAAVNFMTSFLIKLYLLPQNVQCYHTLLAHGGVSGGRSAVFREQALLHLYNLVPRTAGVSRSMVPATFRCIKFRGQALLHCTTLFRGQRVAALYACFCNVHCPHALFGLLPHACEIAAKVKTTQ